MSLISREEAQKKTNELAIEIGLNLFGETTNTSRIVEIEKINNIIEDILLENGEQIEWDESKLHPQELAEIVRKRCTSTVAGWLWQNGGMQFPMDNKNLVETKKLLREEIKGEIPNVVQQIGNSVAEKLCVDSHRANDAFMITYNVLAMVMTLDDIADINQLSDAEQEIMKEILANSIRQHCKYTYAAVFTGGIYFPAENIEAAKGAVKSIMQNKRKLIQAEELKKQTLEQLDSLSVNNEVVLKIKEIEEKLDDPLLLSKEERNVLIMAQNLGRLLKFFVNPSLSSGMEVAGLGFGLIFSNPEKIQKAIASSVSPSLGRIVDLIGGKEQLSALLGSEDFRAMLLFHEKPLLSLLHSRNLNISRDQLHAALNILATKPQGKDFSAIELLDIFVNPKSHKNAYFKDMWQQIRAFISAKESGLKDEIVNLFKKEKEQGNEKTIIDIDNILQIEAVADNIRWLGIDNNNNNRTQLLKAAKELLLEGGARSGDGLLRILDGVFGLSPPNMFMADLFTGISELALDERNKPRNALINFIKEGQLAVIMVNLMIENPALLSGYLGKNPKLPEEDKDFILTQNQALCQVVMAFCNLLAKDENLLPVIVTECLTIVGISNKMERLNAGLKIATALMQAVKKDKEMRQVIDNYLNYLSANKYIGFVRKSVLHYISDSPNLIKFASWIVDVLCRIADVLYQMRSSIISFNLEMTELMREHIFSKVTSSNVRQNLDIICQNIINDQKISGCIYYALTHKECQGVDFGNYNFENVIVDGFKFKNASFGAEENGTVLRGVFKNTDFAACKFRGSEIDCSAAQFDEVSWQSLQEALAASVQKDNMPQIKLPSNELLSTSFVGREENKRTPTIVEAHTL